jgi:hypothetical protein
MIEGELQLKIEDFRELGIPPHIPRDTELHLVPDTLRRELEPLVSTATYFGTQENLIITVNQEQHFDKDGVAVHALPAWQWLLQDDVLFQEKDGSRAASPTAGP